MSGKLATLAVLLVVGGLKGGDIPTPEEVNRNPQKFLGQKLVFDNLQLRGDGWVHPKVMRFVVKTPQETIFATKLEGDQRFFFASPDHRPEVRSFVEPLQGRKYYPARLTCEILKRTEKEYMAAVRRIDLIRFQFAEVPADQVIEGLSVQQVARTPDRHIGKLFAFDGVEFTGDRKARPARIALGVKIPDKVAGEFRIVGLDFKDGNVIFGTPDKGSAVKEYLKANLKTDTGVPLRLVCEWLKTGEGHYVASIRRVDLIGYNYDSAR